MPGRIYQRKHGRERASTPWENLFARTSVVCEFFTSRSRCVSAPVIVACLVAASAAAQTAWEVREAAAVEPLQNEPPAKIIIGSPRAEFLDELGAAPLLTGNVNVGERTPFGLQEFLLAPGGQDCVGDNAYDLSYAKRSEESCLER